MFLSRWHLHTVVALMTTLVILTSSALHSYYLYNAKKENMLDAMQEHAQITLLSLQRNLSYFIDSYAVNDYEILIANEMQHSDYLAIIVEDYNMQQIAETKSAYLTGKIRTQNNDTEEFDAQNPTHKQLIAECPYLQKSKIFSAFGKPIGALSICSTDYHINQELKILIVENILISILFSIILSGVLFLVLRHFALLPIANIINKLSDHDHYGIPRNKLSKSTLYEFRHLSCSINKMIDAIHRYQIKEKVNLNALNMERKRFELAIEGTQDGLWDWDIVGKTVFFSPQWKKMIGYEDEEIDEVFTEWYDRIHPEDRDTVMYAVNAYLEGKTDIYEIKHRLQSKDGSWKWILARGKAFFDDGGKPIRFVGFHTDITNQIAYESALEQIAKYDTLTNLPNRFLFNELIENMLDKAIHDKKGMALIYLDLDGFKEVNDLYGHQAGDAVLIEVAKRMQKLLRQGDIIARFGGDEFVIALNDTHTDENIILFLNRLFKDINTPILLPSDTEKYTKVSASAGISIYPQQSIPSAETLLRQADQAMYQAKNAGKNQYRFFDVKHNQSLKERYALIEAFSKAITENELELYYQPKVDMARGEILGFETLLRWNHPTLGMLYPDDFLSTFQDNTAPMLQLGRWVFESAFKQLSLWISKGYRFTLSINISALEFNDKGTLALIDSLIREYPMIDPSCIELEILETYALDNKLFPQDTILGYQSRGLSVSIDDFGTGYSTMSYLKNLPVNALKIDKSFIIEMLHDSGSLSIVKATIGLADAFSCSVTAEGVETEAHGILLIRMGCTIGQGYAISKPMQATKVETWIKEWKTYDSWLQD